MPVKHRVGNKNIQTWWHTFKHILDVKQENQGKKGKAKLGVKVATTYQKMELKINLLSFWDTSFVTQDVQNM